MSGAEELGKKQLSPAKQQLLKKLLGATTASARNADSTGIPQCSGRRDYPLSFAQRRLWFTAQLEAKAPVYNIVRGFRLEGPLEPEALEKSFAALVRRHASLRTRFEVYEGELVQIVAEEMPLSFTHIDLRTAGGAKEQDAAVAKLLHKESHTGFDLSRGPLLRCVLATLGRQSHGLIITIHHIVIDDWSLGIFLKELSVLYESIVSGQTCTLPALPIQYTDFAIWQNRLLESGALASQVNYWQKQLAGMPMALNLPRRKSMQHSGAGERLTEPLPAKLSRELRKLCQARGVTLFEMLLTAFNVLLACYSGESDIVAGTVISNRDREELEPLLGFLTNVLVLRTFVPFRSTFAELLEHGRTILLDAQSNKDLPFEYLVRMLLPDRKNLSAPLVQLMFVLQNSSEGSLSLNGISCSGIPRGYSATTFELDFVLEQSAEELKIIVQYHTEVFEDALVRRMMSVYKNILQAVVQDPDLRISEVPLVSATERAQILALNPGRTEFPLKCLHELFETQVARTPHSIALHCEERQLSYLQLNRRANQLAHYLSRFGVGPEIAVGISLNRGPDAVLAALAVMKAGGAYVPLDPEYPADRLAYMLQHSRAKVLLVDAQVGKWASGAEVKIVDLKKIAGDLDRESPENPDSGTMPLNLAYVIYTSGSTGLPKGVMISHRAICNHLLWRQEAYPLTPADRFLHKASFSFDIAVWEMFGPLLAGATLVIAVPGGQQDSAYLARLIATEKVTVAHFNPSMMRVFLAELRVSECRELRRVFCGGEVMSVELKERFLSLVPAELHNQYGPTETTVDVLFWNCSRDAVEDMVPIGRPIANTSVYILGADMQLVPPGVAGELYIGNEPLARGYLDRPDLTAERFVPDPFSTCGGDRLYRTGDLARYRDDGAIEFIGRIDRQVKLRGFRIELEEIEAVLRGHAATCDAAVVLRSSENGDPLLAAYVVGESSVADLRGHAVQKLPPYMCPATFTILPKLPRTPNGKINIAALPAPEMSGLRKERISPRNLHEEIVYDIWREMLDYTSMGVEDSFFEIGGHSLLAAQIMARVNLAFKTEVPLRSFFEEPTIFGLVKRVQEAQGNRNHLENLMNLLQYKLQYQKVRA
jgi:amino acid adenylation domain-containing protein